MTFDFHPDAEKELYIAIDFPDAWQWMTPQTRRCLTNRFPFAIVYQKLHGTVIIIAVMHQHQKPFYWNKRV